MKIELTHIVAIILYVFLSTTQVFAETQSSESNVLNVTCPNKTDQRVLTFNPEKNLWCDDTLIGFCKPKRLGAARYACSKRYALALSNEPSTQSLEVKPREVVVSEHSGSSISSVDSARERIRLEQELLDIKERLLEVRRRQVELDRQELRLQQL